MTHQKAMTAGAWGLMAALGLVWGASFLSIEVALEEVGVATTVALRVGGACVVLWAVVGARGLPLPRGPRAWGAFLVMGILNNALPFSLITWGQRSIDSGLAAILNASTALMGVLVAAALFRDERLTSGKAVGVGVGFAGVVVAIGPAALRGLDLASLGQLAVLVASLSYALSGAFARVALVGLAPEVAAAGMLTASSAIMLPVALAVEGWPGGAWSAGAWGALAYLSLAATAGAYLIFYRLIARAGAGNALLATLLVAPVAILLGAVVLGEDLPGRAYAGFALLALGLVMLDGRALARAREVLA